MPTRRITRAVILALALAAVGLVAFVFASYQRDIGLADERVSTGSQVISTACGPIEFAVAGNGPPVLIVHGAGGGFDQGLAFGQGLIARGFRVIAMSRFGYLRTPLSTDASAAAQADAHACLLDALGIRQVAVIGASAGAPSAMQLALRHPERCRAMVLLVPAAYVPHPTGTSSMQTPAGTQFLFDTALQSDFLFWAAIRLARPMLIQSILATPTVVVEQASADEQARVDHMLQNILPVSPRRLGLLNDARVTASLPRYELERIDVPTLVISLVDDRFGTYAGARYTAQHLPHARFVGYASGGHVWVGHDEEVNSEISAFLKTSFTQTPP